MAAGAGAAGSNNVSWRLDTLQGKGGGNYKLDDKWVIEAGHSYRFGDELDVLGNMAVKLHI